MTTHDRITRLIQMVEMEIRQCDRTKFNFEIIFNELKTIRDGEPVTECRPRTATQVLQEQEDRYLAMKRIEAEKRAQINRTIQVCGLGPPIE